MDKGKGKPTTPPAPAAPKPGQARSDKKTKGAGNPPFTTKHGMTSPKFGSAGSGGAENEPGPEAD